MKFASKRHDPADVGIWILFAVLLAIFTASIWTAFVNRVTLFFGPVV